MRQRPRSLKPLLDPETIAVIGASNNVQKFGGRPIHYMLQGGFEGRIYPINPRQGEVQGLKAYADVRELPEKVDLVIISLPAPQVVDAVRACVEAEVGGVAIFSSGFAEVGGDGVGWQRELAEIARGCSTRLVGPNCMGVLNAHSHAVGTFSSSFEHGWPRPGPVAVISQSGAVGSHSLVLARERGLGLSAFITTGNECDVDVADCIAYCADDPQTQVVVAYMEGCRNPDRLRAALESCRRNRKAVVVMKVGASAVGAAAATSHTASLAGADEVFDAVFRQYGAHRARSLEEMIDVAAACSSGHYPTGNRLGIVTISGGVGVLSSDTATQYGLDVPALPDRAQQELKALMPFAAVRNPVDTTAQMLNDMNLLRRNMEVILDHGACDAVLVFLTSIGFSPRLMDQLRDLLPEMRQRYPDRLIVMSLLCSQEDRGFMEAHRYLVFEDPTRAIAAIAALIRFGAVFARGEAEPPPALPPSTRPAPRRPLNEVEAAKLLADAGIPIVDSRLAVTEVEAVAAAEVLGYPVAMKVVSSAIQHKSDVGGVRLDLGTAEAVAEGYRAIRTALAEKAPDARIDGVLVAPMVRGGIETIIGVHDDPVFGPVVLFGLGGIFVELLKDVTFRVAPFGVDEARRMIDEVRGRAALDGVRGRGPADVETLALALARLSVFAARNRDAVASIDINPFLVREKGEGAVAVDALIVPKP